MSDRHPLASGIPNGPEAESLHKMATAADLLREAQHGINLRRDRALQGIRLRVEAIVQEAVRESINKQAKAKAAMPPLPAPKKKGKDLW